MKHSSKDGLGRRQSASLFSRSAPTSNIHSADALESTEKKTKLTKRSSIFQLGPNSSPDPQDDSAYSTVAGRANSTTSRHRILQKSRTGSVFGSLGRKTGITVEDEDYYDDTSPTSPAIERWPLSEQTYSPGGKNVLHHGEVQTTSGLFRKKKEYLVLTDTHFVRFKSHARACEAYQSISPSIGRASSTRHASTASIGSLQDGQSLNSHASAENDNAIPLKQIVATYKVEDGRPFYTTEVVYLDEEFGNLGSIQLIIHDSKEADLWHTSIRGAAQKARLLSSQPYPERVVRYLVGVLEAAQDYDPNFFQIFRVVRRAVNTSVGRSSSDEISKLGSNVFYMVIGINRLHLISLPEFSLQSSRIMDAKANKNSFGLVTLVSMDVRYVDDTFELGFRQPLQMPTVLDLAAASAPEIATLIFRSILFLKPQWLDHTFLYGGPPEILDDSDSPIPSEEDNGFFDRTLVAYCVAYNCNPGRIRYTVDLEAEDAPCFQLLPPDGSMDYSFLELLAVFRALRFNESFRSISFNGISLQSLYGLVDFHGRDHIATTSRSGVSIRRQLNIEPVGKSLLYQEVQALALKVKRLRRLNFGNTLPRRRPKDTFDEEGRVERDPGSELTAALLPLCRSQLTSVDWIILSGIELGEADVEELALALDNKQCRFRSIEVSRCGLSDRGMQLFLNSLERQNATLESINISDNSGRLQLETFPLTLARFSLIRRLDLSRVPTTRGPEPLITPEVMLSWRLEQLILTGFKINDSTLDSISTYLASDMSEGLYCLQMEQCNLTGAHVALLMRSMCHTPGMARNLHLHVSANRLEKGNSEIVKAIEENLTPTHLTMRMVEYGTESRFRQLLHALRVNTTIQSLDISKASLPGDAGEDTCKALQSLFEENTTLEELDISGEHAHLEVARFGIGLNYALMGLKRNRALKVLKIEYQNLGLEGSNTLSSVLEENKTLQHIFCEHNDINLQGFTVLINALAQNLTVLSLPPMLNDQAQAVKRMTLSIGETRQAPSNKVDGGVKSSVRRTLTNLRGHVKESPIPSPQDIDQAIQILHSRWQKQIERLNEFLVRNHRIAAGLETHDMYPMSDDTLRPSTAHSDSVIIDSVLTNSTPRLELGDPVDAAFEREISSLELAAENQEPITGPWNESALSNGLDELSLAAVTPRTFDLHSSTAFSPVSS
ncbi:MAG: hypothetical protein M1818_000304 [Claussenomyces sp. TS43310]|nr:MAG: hypothetical protein M1818_000304 [Claussenomyces sp. TS43310]